MKRDNGLDSRIEFRIESDSKQEIQTYCKERKLDISEFGREALISRMKEKKLVSLILRSLQDKNFFKLFETFLKELPRDVASMFESLIGPEEKRLIEKLPEEILCSVNIITEEGIRARENRCFEFKKGEL